MASKWEHFPRACQVTNDGLTLNRLSPAGSHPEFSVALSGRLEDNEKHEIEVFYSGDCTYFGVGVTQSTIPLQESPRRLEPGNAWFFLNKGFLCDGRTFRDDTLDPVGPNKSITVAFDRPRGRLTLSSDHVTIGVINNVSGDSLHFFCYLNGNDSHCTIVSHDSLRALQPLGAAEMPNASALSLHGLETPWDDRQATLDGTGDSLEDKGIALFERRRLALTGQMEGAKPIRVEPGATDSQAPIQHHTLHAQMEGTSAKQESMNGPVLDEKVKSTAPVKKQASFIQILQEKGVNVEDAVPSQEERVTVQDKIYPSIVYMAQPEYIQREQRATGMTVEKVTVASVSPREGKASGKAGGTGATQESSGAVVRSITPQSSTTSSSNPYMISSHVHYKSSQDYDPSTRNRSHSLESGHAQLSSQVFAEEIKGRMPHSVMGAREERHVVQQQASVQRLRSTPSSASSSVSHQPRSAARVKKVPPRHRVKRCDAATQSDPCEVESTRPADRVEGMSEADVDASDELRMTHLLLDDLLSQLPTGNIRDLDTKKVEEVFPAAQSKVTYHLLHRLWEKVRVMKDENPMQATGTTLDAQCEDTMVLKSEIKRLSTELASSERERWSLGAELTRMTGKVSEMEQSIISLQRQCFHKSETLKSMLSLEKPEDEWRVGDMQALGDAFGLHVETPCRTESTSSRMLNSSQPKRTRGSPSPLWATPSSHLDGGILSPQEGFSPIVRDRSVESGSRSQLMERAVAMNDFETMPNQQEFGLASTPMGGNTPRQWQDQEPLGLVASEPPLGLIPSHGTSPKDAAWERQVDLSSAAFGAFSDQRWRVITDKDDASAASRGLSKSGPRYHQVEANKNSKSTRNVELKTSRRAPSVDSALPSVLESGVAGKLGRSAPLRVSLSSSSSNMRHITRSPPLNKEASSTLQQGRVKEAFSPPQQGRRVVSVLDNSQSPVESYGALC